MDKKLVLFAGPSAVGKSFIANKLMALYPNKFEQTKLYTTRPQRKNEESMDRIFISTKVFDSMLKDGSFIIHAEFAGNMYGFTEESLTTDSRHLLFNTWPWLVPEHSKMAHAVVVGMQAPETTGFLIQRMKKRGDNQETITKRLDVIKKDTADLENNKDIVEKHGKYFVIKDDSTVENEIIPWLEDFLKLKS